jgi:hypothetical protein
LTGLGNLFVLFVAVFFLLIGDGSGSGGRSSSRCDGRRSGSSGFLFVFTVGLSQSAVDPVETQEELTRSSSSS